MKTLPAGVEFFHADRRTGFTNVSFRNYATAPTIVWCFTLRLE